MCECVFVRASEGSCRGWNELLDSLEQEFEADGKGMPVMELESSEGSTCSSPLSCLSGLPREVFNEKWVLGYADSKQSSGGNSSMFATIFKVRNTVSSRGPKSSSNVLLIKPGI